MAFELGGVNKKDVIDKIKGLEVQASNSNLEITNIKSDIQNLEADFTSIQTEVNTIKNSGISNTEINNLKTEFGTLKTEVQTNKTDISILQNTKIEVGTKLTKNDNNPFFDFSTNSTSLNFLAFSEGSTNLLSLGKTDNTKNINITGAGNIDQSLVISGFKNGLQVNNSTTFTSDVTIQGLNVKTEIENTKNTLDALEPRVLTLENNAIKIDGEYLKNSNGAFFKLKSVPGNTGYIEILENNTSLAKLGKNDGTSKNFSIFGNKTITDQVLEIKDFSQVESDSIIKAKDFTIGSISVKDKLEELEDSLNNQTPGTNVDTSDLVSLSLDQEIGGIKTFTNLPVVPDSIPNRDTQVTSKKYVDSKITEVVQDSISDFLTETEIENKISGSLTSYRLINDSYTKTEVDNLISAIDLSTKVDVSSYNTDKATFRLISDSYTKTEVDSLIAAIPATDISGKLDISTYNADKATFRLVSDSYTRTEVDDLIDAIPEPDLSIYYTKTEVDGLVDGLATESYVDTAIANAQLASSGSQIEVYSKTEVEEKLALKLDTSTYNTDKATFRLVDDSYTKIEVDSLIAAIPETDLSPYYTKTETDALLGDYLELTDFNNTLVDLETKIGLKADKTQLTGLATETYVDDAIAAIPATDISGKLDVSTYEQDKLTFRLVDDSYTKTEIDTKLSSVFTLKGVIADRAALPDQNNNNGDIYVIQDEDNLIVAWDGSKWDNLSNVDVDLTGYLTKTEFNTEKASLETSISSKVSQSEYDTKIEEIENTLDEKADKTQLNNLATEAYVTNAIANSVSGGTLNLDGYATEEYVDNSISGLDLANKLDLKADKTSLAGLATETYVDNAIAAIPAVDLSPYITLTGNESISGNKSFVDTLTIPTPVDDMHASTKKYVDDSIAAIPAVDISGKLDISTYNTDRATFRLINDSYTKTEVDSLIDAIPEPDLSVYYTKTEIDTKLSSVFTMKGVVATKADLPTQDQENGDIYVIQDEHNLIVAWNGLRWDDLSNAEVDLTDYLTKTEFNTEKTNLETSINAKTPLTDYNTKVQEIETRLDTLDNSQGNFLQKGLNEFTTSGSLVTLKMGGNSTGYLTFITGNTAIYDIGRVYADGNYNLLFRGNSTSANTTGQKAVFTGFRGGVDIQTDLMVTNNGNFTLNGVNVGTKLTELTNSLGTKADKTQLTGLATETYVNDAIAAIPAVDISGKLDITDYNADKLTFRTIDDSYSKTEIDTKLSSVFTMRGTVTTRANLPTQNQENGDIYVIQDEDNLIVAWDGSKWDNLSNVDVDLTGYLTKTEFSTEKTNLETSISSKVDQGVYDTKIEEIENTLDEKADKTQLTGLATETYVDNAIAAIPAVDLSPYITLTGDVSIDGVKTFTSSPVVPDPTADTDAANKSYVDTNLTSVREDINDLETRIQNLEAVQHLHVFPAGTTLDATNLPENTIGIVIQ